MIISPEDVEHVAKLARLSLEEGELERLTVELNSILTYMDQLRQVDTQAVEPTTHAMELFNVLRDDQVRPSMGVEEVLANAPRRFGDSFQVPRVIE
jgi:aspartyl-tRNA(Asn)/glutamyl-tRNA(Gln) amidotransferase subunit C